jgi:hypothetical protein
MTPYSRRKLSKSSTVIKEYSGKSAEMSRATYYILDMFGILEYPESWGSTKHAEKSSATVRQEDIMAEDTTAVR